MHSNLKHKKMKLDIIFYRENEDIRNRYCEEESELLDFFKKEIDESDYYLITMYDAYLVCKNSGLFSILIANSNNTNAIGVKCISEKEYEIFNLISDL